jgi:hypothetical protein
MEIPRTFEQFRTLSTDNEHIQHDFSSHFIADARDDAFRTIRRTTNEKN